MLTKALLEIMAQLAPTIKDWPRRQPGLLVVNGKLLRYADLFSTYHHVREIFEEKIYGFRCDEPSPYILDCGAHIGLASLYLKEHLPSARIHAFEADPDLAELCRANFASFGATDTTITQAAVWTHDRGVSFEITHDDSGYVSEATQGGPVPSVRLKSLLERERVHFLKLDVEGAEFDLIADCGDALDNVDRIFIEVHAMGNDQAPIGALLHRLETAGFQYVLGDLHPAVWVTPKSPSPFVYCSTRKFIISVFAWHPRISAERKRALT